MKLGVYIKSFRLRTLPLSMSGIILGTGWAFHENTTLTTQSNSWLIFLFAILTTLSLQILSNLCNELGDSLKGTDTGQNAREAYGLQAGKITIKQMKRMIYSFVVASIVFGTALIYTSFGTLFCNQSLVFFCLGALAIIGAITYTLGKHNYGYIGLGDLGVFLFFGLLSTMGSYYLQTMTINADILLAAIAIALPIVGVLNLNNIRDMPNDVQYGKRTFASWLGPKGARIYHTLLLVCCLLIFTYLERYFVLISLPVLTWHIWYIFRHEGAKLDIQMPVLMFTTIVIAILAIF